MKIYRPSSANPRGWISLALILVFPVLADAQDLPESQKSFTLSTSTNAGILYGRAFEYVYNQKIATDYKNSELMWPFKPLFYAGAGLSLSSKMGLFANLELRQAFAGKTGTMTDSDFLNGDGVKTHYSESDCYTERAVFIDFKVGYALPYFRGPLKVSAYGGFSYMNFKWSARDGYYQYPTSGSMYSTDSNGNLASYGTYAPWSADATKTPIYGTGIINEQAYLFGLLGVQASYKLDEAFTLGAAFSAAPIARCYTADNHELRMVDFYSQLSGGFMFEPSLSLEYAVKPGAALRLDVSYRQASGLKGDITQVLQGTSSTSSGGSYFAGPDSAGKYKDGSGASISMLDAKLSFSLQF
jgi:outer membrane protease